MAFLARTFRDLDLAEDGVQEAYAAALARWPREGIPDQPGAWLLTVARNRALDRVRRNRRFAERMPEIRRLIDQAQALGTEPEESMDHQLAMLLACCHPALAMEARVALTLRLVGGLTTVEIARERSRPGSFGSRSAARTVSR